MSVKNDAAGVFVVSENKILLVKRSEICPISKNKISYGGYWSFLCGSQEDGEASIDCAIRESYEEARIKIKPSSIEYFSSICNSSGWNLHIHFAELRKTPKVKLNFEHVAYLWWDIGSLDSFPYKKEEKLWGELKKYVEKNNN
jgi:8-oxo-dGTP pyrophosphatase MutT (NUDIX family)